MELTKLSLFIIIICALSVVLTESARVQSPYSRSRYGEFCNATSKCYKGAWLTCQNGNCKCARPEEMIYDIQKQKCVSMAGERCKFEVASDVSINEQTDCVENSKCGFDGICTCGKLFYEIPNGTCLPQNGNAQSCISQESCRGDKFLECIEGICSCNQTTSEYSKNAGHCVGLSNQACLNEKCTPNSKCILDRLTRKRICSCYPEDGYFQNSEGRCELKRGFGVTCRSDNECKTENAFLKCFNGICTCDLRNSKYELTNYQERELDEYIDETGIAKESYYEDSYFPAGYRPADPAEKERHECVGLADSPCNPNQECVKNSICSNSKCECNYGYSKTSNGICGLDYGRPCDNDRVCSDNFVCSRGICACKDYLLQIHSPETSTSPSRCVGIVSARCTNSSECMPNTICKFNETAENGKTGRCECDDTGHTKFVLSEEGQCQLALGSSCDYRSKNEKCAKNSICSNSKCECSSGYTGTSKGICGRDYGSSCDNFEVCTDNFVCSKGKCACKDYFHQIHSPSLSKCVGIASARCANHTDCIPNTICKFNEITENVRTGRCECDDTSNPKFVENEEGLCELAHGSPCDYKSTTAAETCDKLAELECRNELCSCPEESMVFDEERRQCFQYVGARCSETSPCVPSAMCIRKRLGLSGVCVCPDGFQETSDGKCAEVLTSEINHVAREINDVNNVTAAGYFIETEPVMGLVGWKIGKDDFVNERSNWTETEDMIES